ncbi:MAG: ATP-binding protein [Candidatus Krumholzibacteriia bacterium]
MATGKETKRDAFPADRLGQESAQAFLDACLGGTLPCLLFTGPEGVGKERLAIDFARRLCCASEPACRPEGTPCDSCRAALALSHPGIHLVYPTPTQGTGEKEGDDEPDIGKVLEEKRRDIFSTHVFKKKASIRVARARAVIKRAHSKPFNSPYNVFIIVDAHLMREEAQNALLKLVEEPPAHCALILVTHTPDAILHTIRSRCQRVRFAPLRPEVLEALLVTHDGTAPGTAARAAGLAQGSYKRARRVVNEDSDDERRNAYEILERIPGASESWLIGSALTVARGASRDGVARFLHEFALAYRDIMTGDTSLYINRDQAALLDAQRDKWDRQRLPAIVDRITWTRDEILRRNLNMDAALTHLFLDIKHLGC